MKVILLEELKGRGGEGDVIDVATGYAVNYLFPKKIAITATKGNLKQLELRKHNIAKREAERIDSADKLVATLEGKSVRIAAKVGEEGQLFGSVTASQIADAIAEKFNTEVDRRRIDVHGAIKTAGAHEVTVNFYRDLKATLVVEVVDENAVAEAAVETAAVEVTPEGDTTAVEAVDNTAVEASEAAVAAEAVVEALEAAAAENVATEAVEGATADEAASSEEEKPNE